MPAMAVVLSTLKHVQSKWMLNCSHVRVHFVAHLGHARTLTEAPPPGSCSQSLTFTNRRSMISYPIASAS